MIQIIQFNYFHIYWKGLHILSFSPIVCTIIILEALIFKTMHTGLESPVLSNNSFSAVFGPILMPNTANWGFSGWGSPFLGEKNI